jgi:carbonic anhydrase
MNELLDGYRRFRTRRWQQQRASFEELAHAGQQPHTLAIACCDSRVAPEMIFDCAPGDIFTVRNIANLVPPYAPDEANHGTSAALEFGVRVLGVRRIAVIGHSGCGGVAALMGGAPPEARDFVAPWVRIAEPAKRRAERVHPHDPEAARMLCEIESVRVSLENLQSFPWIATAHLAGRLRVEGFYFDVGQGALHAVWPDRLEILEDDMIPETSA